MRRRAVGVVATAVVVLVGFVLTPGVAVAGGPTSVLLASPSSGRAAALYNSDAAYGRLMALLDGTVEGTTRPQPAFAGAAEVNVTWMIHDVSVWRIDRISIDAGGTRISTRSSIGADGSTDTTGLDALAETWRPVADPPALHAMLTELGLIGVPAAGGSPAKLPAVAAAPAPAAASAATAPTAAPDPAGAERDGPWWWAAAGALIGAGALALGLRTSTTLRRRLLPAT